MGGRLGAQYARRHSIHARFLASACAILAPVAGQAQTTTDVAANTTRATVITIGGTDSVTVEGTLSVGGTPRAINFNANGSGAGPTITNSSTITDTNATNPRAIDSTGDFANRSITIRNTGTISGATDAIRITNTANAATGSVIAVINSGLITSSGGQGVEVSGMSGAMLNLTNNVGGTISGSQAIINDSSAMIFNNGTLTGTGTATATGEAIRLTGNGANIVTLGAGSVTQTNVATANANAIAFFGTGANTLNIAAGATVGRLKGSANSLLDTLNLGGSGNGTLGLTVDFDTLNVNSGAWTTTSASTTFSGTAAIAAGASVEAGSTGGLMAGAIVNNGMLTASGGAAAAGIAGTAFSLTNAAGATITGVQGVFSDASATIVNNGTIIGTSGSGEAMRLTGNGNYTVTLGAASVTQNTSTTPTAPSAITFFGTGTNTVNIAAGATFGRLRGSALGTADTLNLTGPGNGTLVASTDFEALNINGGTWSVTGANVVNGTATIAAGAIAQYVDQGAAGGLITAGAIVNNGQFVNARSNLTVQSTAISGTGGLRMAGTGTWEFAANNSYGGDTLIDQGRIFTDIDNALSANSAVTIGLSGTLSLNDNTTFDADGNPTPVAHDQTIANLSGSGIVRLGQINAATLTTGGGGGDTLFSGTLAQLGNLTKVGTGTLTLSGANTATGLLRASGGTIALTGSFAGRARADNGATITGGGSLGGQLLVADGGTIAPGNGGIGTISVGQLNLSAGSILAYDVGANRASDRITVNGNVILDGTLNLNDVGGFGQGVYRLVDYTGALTDNGLIVGTIPLGADASQMSIQTAITYQVNLVYGANTAAPIQFWDGMDTTANGVIDGGSGSWTNAQPNWTVADGTANTAWGGNFAVFQGGPGTVTVDDAIGVGGLQFSADGYVIAPGTGTLSANEALTNLRVDSGVTGTISAAITGPGGLLKNDAGTLILSGANNYAGATTIAGGAIRTLGGGAIPAASAVSVQSGATLDIGADQSIGSIAGAGALILSGGSLTTGALNTNTALSGIVSGAGGLTKIGTGTFTLSSGANSYSGATSVVGGTLNASRAGSLGSGRLDVATGATVNISGYASTVDIFSGGGRINLGTGGSLATTGAADGTFSGQLVGTNTILAKGGSGTLTLSGATGGFAGAISVDAGRLTIADQGALDNLAQLTINAGGTFEIGVNETVASLVGGGTVALGGNRLTINAAQDGVFGGSAQGTGGITKAGGGTLTLTGANSYTGDTIVAAGTTLVTGSIAGGATAQTGSIIGGTGTIAGTLNVTEATLAPGANGVGTLTLGGLSLGANSTLAFQLGAPGVAGASDRIQVNGDLTLDGTLNVTDVGGFGQGVYRLIDYSGALTDNGLTIGAQPPARSQVQTAIANQINLVVANTLPSVQFWDGANTSSNGGIDGGSGAWDNVTANWTNAAGTGNDNWGGLFAVFQGAAGTVTLNDVIAITGIQFATNGYVIAAGTGSLAITDPAAIIRVDPGVTATVNASINGAGGINKLDSGTLILGGVNGFAGATAIGGGTLRVTTTGALPGTSAVSVATGATLDLAASQTIASLSGAGAVALSGGSLTTGGSGASTQFDGVVSGSGGLTKAGAGVFTLAGTNTYTGGTTISGGTVRLANGGRIGGGDLAIATGATFDMNGFAAGVAGLDGTGAITLGSATLSAGGAANTSFGGTISGTGGLIKTGSGTLTLGGANGYTGATRVAAGTLMLASAGAVTNTAAVSIDLGASLALGVNKTIASLDGAGGVALGANMLSLSSGSYTGTAGGTGGLTKTGTGSFTLGGVQAFTGATTIAGGTIVVAQGGSLASSSSVGLTTSGATLDLSSAGTQTIGALSGVTGTSVRIGSGGLTQNSAASTSFAGVLSGSGGFTKAGTGTLTLAAASTYGGATTIAGGVLRAGAARAFAPGALIVQAGGTADLANFNQTVASIAGAGAISLGSATLTTGDTSGTQFSGAVSGAGGLTKVGTGTLILSGASSYTGATAVNAGLLTVNGGLASIVTVGANGRLGGNGAVGGLTVNGTLAPGNSIGTLTVNGNLQFGASSIYQVEVSPSGAADLTAATGVVTISGGTVSVLTGGVTNYAPQTNYTILTGTGGVSGQFTGIGTDLAFLTPSLTYSANAVTLRLLRNDVSFASIGATPNQIAVGTALGRQSSGALFDAVVNLDAGSARNAFDAVSGEVHADALTIANREAQAGQRPLLDRIAANDGSSKGVAIWLQGVAGKGDVEGGGGFAGIDLDRIGLLGGVDYSDHAIRVGVAGGYTKIDADIDDRASQAKIKNAQFAVYGGLSAGRIRIRAGAGYLHHEVSTDRAVTIGTLSDRPAADYAGDTLQAFGEIGYRIGDVRFAVEPFGGIAFARTRLDAVTETGAAAALALSADTASSTLATAGIRASGGSGGGLRIDAELAARHYLEEGRGARRASFTSTDQGFTVTGADFGQTGGIARIGARLPALRGWVGVSGEADVTSRSSDYNGRLTIGWRF